MQWGPFGPQSLLFVVCCLLFAVCCLLFDFWCLLFVVCCLLLVGGGLVRWLVGSLLFVVCCFLFVVCCVLSSVRVSFYILVFAFPFGCWALRRGFWFQASRFPFVFFASD